MQKVFKNKAQGCSTPLSYLRNSILNSPQVTSLLISSTSLVRIDLYSFSYWKDLNRCLAIRPFRTKMFLNQDRIYQRQEQSGHWLCNFSEWTLTTSQKFDLFALVFRSLIPNTTSSTDVLLRHYNHNSAISSENSGSAKEIYLSNHGRSLNIRIGQNYTTYTAQRGSPHGIKCWNFAGNRCSISHGNIR